MLHFRNTVEIITQNVLFCNFTALKPSYFCKPISYICTYSERHHNDAHSLRRQLRRVHPFDEVVKER